MPKEQVSLDNPTKCRNYLSQEVPQNPGCRSQSLLTGDTGVRDRGAGDTLDLNIVSHSSECRELFQSHGLGSFMSAQ